MPDDKDISYIGSTDYKILEDKLKELKSVMDDVQEKSNASRKLRYAEIDIETEREAGRLQPDELYVPQHIIDTNIRREQSPYVQYITQSPRAVILEDQQDSAFDLNLLERDLTKKLRFDGWQLGMFANIDSFQANGYSIMEVVLDLNNPGELGHESVQFGDFAFISDTRDIQAVEMTSRAYYFTKTRLLSMCPGDGEQFDPTKHFNREQVDRVINSDKSSNDNSDTSLGKDRSLYKIFKNMFRVRGVVNVGWSCCDICSDWIRVPRPLFIGRKKPLPPQPTAPAINLGATQPTQQQQQPVTEDQYETQYPYFLFPYLISENDTISRLKGRVFLDQDIQEAVSSLLSSTVTQARRSAGMYFSKDISDPNDDLLLQKNIFFKSGCIINSKVTSFSLPAPDPSMFSAIQMLVSGNQNETSQVNFAVNNRKDSRKTAKEVEVASNQAQILSTVQVVLFSLALKNMYTTMCDVIKSRVIVGLIEVSPQVMALYARKFTVKPSGDTDVIEKQQLVQTMMTAWPVIQNTPAAQAFLSDLVELMFPLNAAKYIQSFMQAQQAQQSQQAQQQQQVMAAAQSMGAGIVKLSEHPEYFSDIGRIHAFPLVEQSAERVKAMAQQQEEQQKQAQQKK